MPRTGDASPLSPSGSSSRRTPRTPRAPGPGRIGSGGRVLSGGPVGGVEERSTPELLACVLGWRGEEGVGRARRLFQSLDRDAGRLLRPGDLFQRPTREVEGFGKASALRLRAAVELGRRALEAPPPDRARMRGPEDVVRLLAPRLRGLAHEEFHVVLLNTRHRVLGVCPVSRGILDASLVHPREVFGPALEARAAAVILVHNHPSGDPEPSPEDHRVTRQMAEAGEVLGIRVLDHVVIGDPGWRAIPVGGAG